MNTFFKKASLLITTILLFSCSGDDENSGPTVDPNSELIQNLTDGLLKKWYWAASETGHFAIGDNTANAETNYFGNISQAVPFEKAESDATSCLYNNVMSFYIFEGKLRFQLENGGQTLFNSAFLNVGGGSGSSDSCLNYTIDGTKSVSISDSDSFVNGNGVAGQTTGKAITISNGGFMGYYIGQSTYEILSLTSTKMVVRAVLGSDASKAIYHTFTTTAPVIPENFDTLVWADEFDVPGAPNPAKWSYNLGANGGWGNNELQNYTNSLENAVVENGLLKIILRKQNLDGSAYTSARLVSENKYEFKYGKVEFRAKLPTGAGTWPALWMLGQNYATTPWPACGEIDVMEHVGNQQNKIHGTLHYPERFGGNAFSGSTTVPTASTEFHKYSVTWGASSIKFYVDDVLFHSYSNVASSPFNADFFIIMNVAMGGNFGGTVDPNFTESSMEVDYVRVYR